MGGEVAGPQREGGQTAAGPHTPRPSLSAAGGGAVCLGGTADVDVCRADVAALGKSSGAEASGHGSGAYHRGEHLSCAYGRDLL